VGGESLIARIDFLGVLQQKENYSVNFFAIAAEHTDGGVKLEAGSGEWLKESGALRGSGVVADVGVATSLGIYMIYVSMCVCVCVYCVYVSIHTCV